MTTDINTSNSFTFEISLSVLNHLGRNLYRNFVTVLGEAISNSWDANAQNVWIYIDRDKDTFLIRDDGDGMNHGDFQNKFLKIGYSKRKEGHNISSQGRPFIGRKGIGKLALLSCADKVTIVSKTKISDYVGGVIDNAKLDDAIKDDLVPSNYELDFFDFEKLKKYTMNHDKGTIIFFENIKEGIRNREEYLRKVIALYFRFSLLDPSFNISLNDKTVTLDDLSELASKTQFLWKINDFSDPYIDSNLSNLRKKKEISMNGKIKGFIASVEKPRYLKVSATDEKLGIDLFVNGRVREKDILKHIPTDRLAADYLYGQIHVDSLDQGDDRFTSSREGIVAGDPLFKEILSELKSKLSIILDEWDKWRIEIKQEGDQENPRLSKKERSSRNLFNAVSDDYSSVERKPKGDDKESTQNREKVNDWVDELGDDAQLNFTSYAECFMAENLIRRYIQDNNIQLSSEANKEIDRWKGIEQKNKNLGNISIDIRRVPSDSAYLSMDDLANLVDKHKDSPEKKASLSRDAKEYKPMRDALMHTSLLTGEAKQRLTTVFENIKGRVKRLLYTK